jgi:hypothetical protein
MIHKQSDAVKVDSLQVDTTNNSTSLEMRVPLVDLYSFLLLLHALP